MNAHDDVHNPLLLKRRDIRLLHLLPGKWDDEIHCRLVIASLDDDAVYEALSYAWGDPGIVRPIVLHQEKADVTTNLESALRHLRLEEATRILWVDALCIDQKNVAEKTHQVGLMDEIYKRCSRVIIWLGSCPPRSPPKVNNTLRVRARKTIWFLVHRSLSALPAAPRISQSDFCSRLQEFVSFRTAGEHIDWDPFALVQHFGDDKHLSELPCFCRPVLSAKNGRLSLRVFNTPAFQSRWEGIISCIGAPWWTRLWCVQEVILPPEAVVRSGLHEISWTRMRLAMRNLFRHLSSCCEEVPNRIPFDYNVDLDNLLVFWEPSQEDDSDDSHEEVGVQSEDSDGDVSVESGSIDGDVGNDLDWLLRVYRHKDCQDARDKVYGILGLVDRSAIDEDTQLLLTPDYSQSVRDVFCCAATAIARNAVDGDLRFLTGRGFNSDCYNLPSWVHNLASKTDSYATSSEMRRLEGYDVYNAWGPRQDEPGLRGPPEIREGMLLCLTGVCCSQYVRRVARCADAKDFWSIMKVLFSWHRVAGFMPQWGSRAFKSPAQKAFWRTLAADLILDDDRIEWERLSANGMAAYEIWVANGLRALRLGRPPPVDGGFLVAVMSAVYGRCLFVTADGRLGLCNPGVQAGDEIWILRGGRVPFILRRQSGGNEGEGPERYRLVGDCYLDGYMDGEVFEGESPRMRDVVLE